MPYRTWDTSQPDFQNRAFQKFSDRLFEELGPEGYSFSVSDQEREGGFRRVFFSKTGPAEESDLYLDLRIGPRAAKGYSIEMATSKPGTYGIPGFSRHVEGEKELRGTINTFADYIRGVYHTAAERQKTPQQVAWTTYQEGSREYQYPASGRVVTPGAGPGMRSFSAQVVPYFMQTSSSPHEYFRKMRQTRVIGLEGHGPKIKDWNAWTPLGTGYYNQHDLLGRQERGVFAPLDPGKMSKGSTLWAEARELADRPMVFNPRTRRYDIIEPTMPGTGTGIRTGWTRSSGVLPGETEPTNMYVQRVAFGDQPDLPGAAYIGPDAFRFTRGGEEIDLFAFGGRANVQYRFGVGSYKDLENLVVSGNLRFDDIEGKVERSGPHKFRFASIQEPSKDNPEQMKERPLLIDRKGYRIRLNKGTLHIPKYYDPETDLFSNFPVMAGDQPSTTDILVENLRKRFGDSVNIAQFSAIGGKGEQPAEVYFNAPVDRIMDVSAKTAGIKAGLSETTRKMFMKFRGMGDAAQKVDMFTQEGKIPGRALMTNFFAMNLQTQLSFLDEFLGGDADALSAVKSYVASQYEGGRAPAIDTDEMAQIYGSAMRTGPMSGDMLFNKMFRNIMTVDDDQKARRMFKEFGVGLPIEQFMSAQTYSKTQMLEMKELINEAAKEVPELKNLITFERLKRDPKSKLVEAMTGETIDDDLYGLQFKVPGRGAVSLMAGTRMVEEYPSQSGFVNTKGIMSLMQFFPEMAFEMGLTNSRGANADWAGPLEGRLGDVRKSTAGWFNMASWMSFQKHLNKGESIIPANAVTMTPRLKNALVDAVTHARAERTSMARLDKLKEELAGLDSGFLVGEEGFDLSDSMLYDPKSGTLLPNLRAIMGIEKEREGVQAGETATYFGENYMNLFEQVVMGGMDSAEFNIERLSQAKYKMFSRIAGSFHPEGGRSKKVFRNITGANLPGSRGGRYQGLSSLEAGEAFADEDYLRSALSQGGFMNRDQISSIMKYLESSPDAYLPVMFQRYPDVSTEYQFVPFKLRHRKYYEKLGKSMPKGPSARSGFFMSQMDANRILIGDWDEDAYGMTILPISDYDPATKKGSGVWKMNSALQKEFDMAFRLYQDPSNVPHDALSAMFGEKAKGLDVAFQNLVDYGEAVTSGETSLLKRLAVRGTYSARELREGQYESVAFGGGMAQSYNRRTLTEDIASAILGVGNDRIRDMAYEAGAMPYQGYLDRMKEMKGGLTQLETMINTFGIYGDELAQGKYRYWFKLTSQGTGQGEEGGRGVNIPSAAVGRILPTMMQKLAREEDWKQSAASLAWGFASHGRGEEVYKALSDPGAYLGQFGYDPARATRGTAMLMLAEQGAVGYDSPYYTSMAFRAVRRLARDHPDAISNRSIKLPWLGNNLMSVADIMETDEYKMYDVATRMTMTGGEPLGAKEFEFLRKFKGDRLGAVFRGIYNTWKSATGGAVETDPVLSEFEQRLETATSMFTPDPQKQAALDARRKQEHEEMLRGIEERRARRAASRMAGGGSEFGNKRIRVGEGGPEEIIVGDDGEVTVVPTSELAESRRARGQDVSQEGYLGHRMAGGAGQDFEQRFIQFMDFMEERFPRRDPNAQPSLQAMDVSAGAQFRKVIGDIMAFEENTGVFNQRVMRIMEQTFEQAGKSDVFNRLQQTGFGPAGMITAAAFEGIPQEDYMPEFQRQGVLPQARGAVKVHRAIKQYQTLLKRHGSELESTLLSPEQQQVLQDKLQFITGVSGLKDVEESFAGAEMVAGMSTQEAMKRTKYLGGTAEMYEKHTEAVGKLTEATQKLEEAQSKGAGLEEAYNEVREAKLREDIARTRIRLAGRQEQVREAYTDGEFIGWEQAEALKDAGVISRGQFDELGDIEAQRAALAGKETALAKMQLSPGQAISRRLGMISRRLLGGFGLMYLQQIGGIIAGPTMRGYQEGMEQELMAGQAFGARAGGYIPEMNIEARIARANAMYGGVGWRGLRGAYANMLETQPGLTGLAGMGQAGIGGFGLAAFMTSMIAPGAAVLPPALIAGGLAAATSYGMQVGGAYQQPTTTAIDLASRTLAGRQQPLMPVFDKAYMARFFEEMGERGTEPEGIIRQQAMIERLGGMLQTGEVELGNIDAMMSRMGIQSRTGQTRMMANIARAMAPQYEVDQQFLYQAMALGQEYQVPLTFGAGGTLELLGAQLQQGVPIEQMARASASMPWLTGQQREQFAAQTMQAWLGRGGLTETDVMRLQERQGLQQALGVMMPNLGFGTETHFERVRRQIEGTGITVPGEELSYSQMAMFGMGGAGRGLGSGFAVTQMERDRYIQPQFEDVMVQREREVNLTEEWLERVRQQAPGVQEAFIERMGVEQMRRARGADFSTAEEVFEAFEGMTEEQTITAQRTTRAMSLMEEAVTQLNDAFIRLGDSLPDPSQFERLETFAQVGAAQQFAQFGLSTAQQMVIGGAAPGMADQVGQAFARMGIEAPSAARMYQGMFQGDRMRWAQWAIENPALAAQLPETLTGIGGSQIQTADLFLTGYDERRGGLTGLPWGRTSLATPIATSEAMAQNIFGDRGTWAEQGYDTGLIDALISGGTRQAQQYQAQVQYNQQMAMYGIQQQQIDLQRRYQPQFWAIQDQYRQLGYAQTEWGLQYQTQQLALSREYFGATSGLQAQQREMQRGWTMEDWAFQDRMRSMQWGWRQEDFAEQVRFMTGRERRLAERGMARETIMHDLEGEQIDKRRARQKEIWSLEDERFALQISHQEAMFDLQEQNIEKQREFFEQRKQLDEEQTRLQRQYWEENMQIQEEALAINVAYAEQMYAIQQTMIALNEHVEDANGRLSLMSEETMVNLASVLAEVDPLFRSFIRNAEDFVDLMDEAGVTQAKTGRQHGGRVYPGESYMVGEAGIEMFQPDVTGTIVPLNDPWSATVVGPETGSESGMIHVVLKVGDETLIDRMLDRVDQEIQL